jgi:hypothetical protein
MLKAREWGQWVNVRTVWRENVTDSPASGDQRVGDQLSVAAPGDGFGTHDCYAEGARSLG